MDPPNSNWLNFVLSCIIHTLLLVPAIWIVAVAAQTNYALFLWHPTCMAVGAGLLMTEAIFGVSGETLIAASFSRANRIKLHWVLHVVGLTLLVIGFGVIVSNKIRNNANHFTSPHGKLGLSTFIISFIVACGGFFTMYSGLLYQKMSLASMKLIHVCCGIICMILLLSSLITGTQGWWPSNNVGRGFVVASYIIAVILLLARPLWNWALKIRGIL